MIGSENVHETSGIVDYPMRVSPKGFSAFAVLGTLVIQAQPLVKKQRQTERYEEVPSRPPRHAEDKEASKLVR